MYQQRGTTALVVRRVRSQIPSFESAASSARSSESFALAPRGLVLVTGPAAAGKSTTLAAMVDYRNRNRPGHIITIEDPIEYLHTDHMSAVSQREVGTDAESFAAALRGAPRQAPDVLVIGEMRDAVSATAAVYFAETGSPAAQHAARRQRQPGARPRAAPSARRRRVRHAVPRLSATILSASSPSAWCRGPTGRACVPAVEVLRATPRVRELIRRGELLQLRQTMAEAHDTGMQTFDDALYGLYQRGMITTETCLDAAESPSDVRMRMRAFSPVGRSAG